MLKLVSIQRELTANVGHKLQSQRGLLLPLEVKQSQILLGALQWTGWNLPRVTRCKQVQLIKWWSQNSLKCLLVSVSKLSAIERAQAILEKSTIVFMEQITTWRLKRKPELASKSLSLKNKSNSNQLRWVNSNSNSWCSSKTYSRMKINRFLKILLKCQSSQKSS